MSTRHGGGGRVGVVPSHRGGADVFRERKTPLTPGAVRDHYAPLVHLRPKYHEVGRGNEASLSAESRQRSPATWSSRSNRTCASSTASTHGCRGRRSSRVRACVA